MAYGLKYTHTTKIKNDDYILKIYQRDYTGDTKTIVNLTDLRFGIVGQNEPDETIVKTQLSFSLIDAPDGHYAATEKGGDWYEFYTQDPTLYKVELVCAPRYLEASVRWTGYITPDSWDEDLRYHGGITIIARDNIGHLQDFDFADYFSGDTFTLAQLVTQANTLIQQNIIFGNAVNSYRLVYKGLNGSATMNIQNVVLYTSLFQDKTLYDALEQILSALGLTLRFFDDNVFGITFLGFFTGDSFSGAVARTGRSAIFLNGSGHHSLNPGFRELTHNITYEYLDDSMNNLSDLTTVGSPKASPYGTGSEDVRSEGNYALVFNKDSSHYITRTFRVPTSTQIELSFGVLGGYYFQNYSYDVLPASLTYTAYAMTARYAIIWHGANGVTYYWRINTASWVTSETIHSTASTADANKTYTAFSISSVTTPSTAGSLEIRIYTMTGRAETSTRYFSCVNEIALKYTITNKVTKHTVRMVNNPLGNIRYKNTNDVGQYVGVPEVSQCVENALQGGTTSQVYGIQGMGLATDGTLIRYTDIWTFIQRQYLCMYKDTTSILEGEIGTYPDSYYVLRHIFGGIFTYGFSQGPKAFYLTGGQFNVLNGSIEGAVLRQIDYYPNIFQEPQMNAYTVRLLDVYSKYEDGTIIGWSADEYIYAEFAGEDSRVCVKCELLCPNAGWVCPRLDAFIYAEGGTRQPSLLTYSPSDTAGHWDFILELQPSDLPNDPREQIPTDIEIGPAAVRGGDEGGPSWDEVPTTGDIYLYFDYFENY